MPLIRRKRQIRQKNNSYIMLRQSLTLADYKLVWGFFYMLKKDIVDDKCL